MVYTYARRRILNDLIRKRFPNLNLKEEKAGIPRMKCPMAPYGWEEITSIYALNSQAISFYRKWRRPMGIMMCNLRDKNGAYDINYVNPLSMSNMLQAENAMENCRIFAEPID